MKRLVWLTAIWMVGCTGEDLEAKDSGSGGEDGGEGSGGGEGGGDDGGGEVDLPDPRERAVYDDGCTDYDGIPVAGATSYFYGQFVATGTDDVWEGEEQWILLANDAWREAGEDDCVITWNVTAQRTDEAGTCGDCTYGLSLSTNIDIARTSCPEGLYEGEESFSVVYGVRVSGETATFVYAQSGNPLGTGYATDGASNYLSEGACTYF
jgi:hypothetical protein